MSEQSIEELQQWHQEYMAMDLDVITSWDHPSAKSIRSFLDDTNGNRVLAVSMDNLTIHPDPDLQLSEGFCRRCSHMLSHWPSLPNESWVDAIAGYYHIAEIEAGSQGGCKFCSFLWTLLRKTSLLELFRTVETRLERLGQESTLSLSVETWGDFNTSYTLWLNLPGKRTTACNNFLATVTRFESHRAPLQGKCRLEQKVEMLIMSDYIATPVSPFDLVRGWIRECSEEHVDCRAQDNLERPSRLVEINEDSIKLVLTSEWKEMPLYGTLSYSWGASEFLKLTPDTLNSFLQGIPLEDLPNTFKDAVEIARRLQLKHLWIDALCIVQTHGENGDWLRESGLMRSIYGGNYVNIAAGSATNVHVGCFSKPPRHNGGFLARVQTDNLCRVQSFHAEDVYEESSWKDHLATRAWALQERLLAPRTLTVGNQGLFWECRTKIASEFLPKGFPEKLGHQMVRPQHEELDWGEVVAIYSNASLTEARDKLPALSGIARRQHEVSGDEYLAGMWRKRLVTQLGWECVGKQQRPAWRAPTWSWASLDGQVFYWTYEGNDDDPIVEYVEVLNASTNPLGPDPFGAVVGGKLQLSCSVMLCGRCNTSVSTGKDTDSDRSTKVTLMAGGPQYPISIDCLQNDMKEGGQVFLVPLFGGESGATYDVSREGDDNERYVAEIMVRGIVLERSDSGEDHFRRMGMFYFASVPGGDNWLDPTPELYNGIMEALRGTANTTASTTACETSAAAKDTALTDRRHVITIL